MIPKQLNEYSLKELQHILDNHSTTIGTTGVLMILREILTRPLQKPDTKLF